MSARPRTASPGGPAIASHAAGDAATPGAGALTPDEQAVASGLAPFRARLDEIDAQLVDLLGERFRICREVAVHKAENEIAMMQPGRVEMVRARYLQHGAEVDLPGDFTSDFFDLMIAATCRAEDELMERLAAGPGGGEPRSAMTGRPPGDTAGEPRSALPGGEPGDAAGVPHGEAA